MKTLKTVDGLDRGDAVANEGCAAINAIVVSEWGADAFHRRVSDLESQGYVARRETYRVLPEVNFDREYSLLPGGQSGAAWGFALLRAAAFGLRRHAIRADQPPRSVDGLLLHRGSRRAAGFDRAERFRLGVPAEEA
jgi:hypothetical protein